MDAEFTPLTGSTGSATDRSPAAAASPPLFISTSGSGDVEPGAVLRRQGSVKLASKLKDRTNSSGGGSSADLELPSGTAEEIFSKYCDNSRVPAVMTDTGFNKMWLELLGDVAMEELIHVWEEVNEFGAVRPRYCAPHSCRRALFPDLLDALHTVSQLVRTATGLSMKASSCSGPLQ